MAQSFLRGQEGEALVQFPALQAPYCDAASYNTSLQWYRMLLFHYVHASCVKKLSFGTSKEELGTQRYVLMKVTAAEGTANPRGRECTPN